MNWICKRLGIVYSPPTIDSSCCNRFPNPDDLLWMVYYWRKKNGRSQVWDHMWNIYAWLPIIPRLCRFVTPFFNVAEKMQLWWRTWVWPLQNHPFMVVNVETIWVMITFSHLVHTFNLMSYLNPSIIHIK